MDDWDAALPPESEPEDDGDEGAQASSPSKAKRSLRRTPTSPAGGKVKKGKAKPGGKAKDRPKKQYTRAQCFILQCEAKVKPNGKFCHHRFNIAAGLRAQAMKFNKLRLYETTMADLQKATNACQDWDDNNPPGTTRKALIDWVQFEKQYGHKVSVTHRHEDVLMDQWDFVAWKASKNMAKDIAELEWQKLLSDPTNEGEGSGATRKLYILKEKKRLRDDTTYIDALTKEGSNAKKNMSEAEKEKLKAFTGKAASFNNEFISKAMRAKDEVDDTGILDRAARKEDGDEDDSEVAFHGPHAFAVHSKDLDTARTVFNQAIEACTASMKAFVDMDEALRTKSMLAYYDLAITRVHISRYLAATNALAVTMPTGSLLIEFPAPPPGSVPGTPGPPTPVFPTPKKTGNGDRCMYVCMYVCLFIYLYCKTL